MESVSPIKTISGNNSETFSSFPKIEKQFVNYMFFRVSADWRKLSEETKIEYKEEFQKVFEDFDGKLLTLTYSLVGFDAKADLLFWRIGDCLDTVQEMTSKLFHTKLGGFLETVDNHLSVTENLNFVSKDFPLELNDGLQTKVGEKKYLFVYPCLKSSEGNQNSLEEKKNPVDESRVIFQKFPKVKIHLTQTLGFNEEYIVGFETDEPKDFLAITEELRDNAKSRLSFRGMPIYTCRLKTLRECLESLG